MASTSPSSLGVALLGSGEMATQLALLWAAAGVPLTVWARSEERLGWLLEDVLEEHPDARLRAAPSAAAATEAAGVLVPALPWGAALGETLRGLLPLLPGRTVLDISNPYEMTPLGPKLAHYVPGGSAAAAVAELLPAGTGHVHAFTHVRSAALAAGAAAGAPLPYVSNAVNDDDAVAALGATGWVPLRVGGIAEASLVEAAGPWDRAAGRDGLGVPNARRAAELGLIPQP
ncbi:NAD(P)-binding domain-containing protein [Galactobacter valiniphilus]|uniref:NAD(P)-binding domain-containing protein n=1 Tax=Galactobacter valiniphilus TaxID=2676122 RepID=UPI003736C571